MYNDKIAELHASEYEYSLPLSKRLQSMTGSDERFIRSLLTCITDHAEYEGKSIRTFKKLKQGYWECLPLQNRMELYNRIEALIENQNLHKYMLIDSYKDAAQRVLRLYNKLLEPGYYRICLKMDMMMNGIYGNQCKSSEEAGEAIREYERRINEVYDYFLENVELSANQIEKNVTAQLDAAFSAKDNAEAISEKASPVLPAVLEGENLTTQFEAILSGKYSDELSDDHVEENPTARLDTADKQMKQPDN